MNRWGMVIDLNRCVGCQTCTIACKHANDTTPGVQWRRVLDVEQGTFPDVERFFMVTGCQHCAEPPCVPVCPTGATYKRADGIVAIDYDVCIGCGYCAVACPYQARTIVHATDGYYGEATRQEQATAHPERLGVAQKCTFCQGRVDAGLARGLTPGEDPEATPACASACISQAIRFGDFADPDSGVSRLLSERPSVQLNAGIGTDPQIRYLYTTPAVPGRDLSAEPEPDEEERLADPANPLAGALQPFWDWRAAMNWIFGGIGTGLAVTAGLLALAGPLEAAIAARIFAASAVLVATGLAFVFLKIGRKLRFWRAVSRPQSSWMTRELYAAALFYPSVFASVVAPGRVAFAFATVSAAAFLLCQAKILHRARGIPAWRAPAIPWMLLASGLFEGVGAFTFALAARGEASPAGVHAAGMILAVVNLLLWRYYLGTARAQGIAPPARAVLAQATPVLHLAGHLLPLVLFGLAWGMADARDAFAALAGGAAVGGGAYWKFTVIVRAGFAQGFRLERVPQRGSGSRAAPPRLAGAGPERAA